VRPTRRREGKERSEELGLERFRAVGKKRGRDGPEKEKDWAAVAHSGEGEGKEPEKERELGCWALFPLLILFFSFSIL
jgi:hypothetical protein